MSGRHKPITLVQLEKIIRATGGHSAASDYAKKLLPKINRLRNDRGFDSLLSQLQNARDPGDFRGRVLEVNFADLFVKKNIEIRYGAKQGSSGDVDFCLFVKGNCVFVEMKLLGQDTATKIKMEKQLNENGFYSIVKADDTFDIARIQRDIFGKSSTKKFNPQPEQNWVNLVAIDVSELQLDTIDIWDCLLAVGGNNLVREHCQRPAVVGVFEPPDIALSEEQKKWVEFYHPLFDESMPHPRGYIHGVLFLFRNPKELAALSYKLSGAVVWNPALIDHTRARSIGNTFYQIVPALVV